ncbi:hypothetical protein [Sedimentibacter sp.]|uniref:hypothetical protein n=1 Tax=Sedimentibacter sp. TaxID=1960295 RepID=UPI0028AA6A16|nr:hypothetical protein [Sedimentibacter sp.]
MKLFNITDKDRRKFLNFYKSQYLNNPLKRDSMSGLLKGLIYGTSELCKSVDLEPLMVIDNNRIIMICILAFAYRMQNFVQIGFFEATELNQEAFQLILNRAEQFANEKGAYKISASLNIHVNYGLGFLASGYNKKQSFGMAHNPEFYHEFFTANNFEAIEMVSYKKDMRNTDKLLSDEMVDKLNGIYTVREADFSNLKREAEIYTEINNLSFKEHLFYYPRKKEEDYELFKDLRFLIKPENLLFVEKDSTPVGFMLWYPDFNQIMSSNETVGLKTVIKNKLFSRKIDTFKIVEMGVIPGERSKGAILCLFNYCFKCIRGKYDYMESGWILSDNTKSKSFGIKWADCESKRYKAYIKVLNNEQI